MQFRSRGITEDAVRRVGVKERGRGIVSHDVFDVSPCYVAIVRQGDRDLAMKVFGQQNLFHVGRQKACFPNCGQKLVRIKSTPARMVVIKDCFGLFLVASTQTCEPDRTNGIDVRSQASPVNSVISGFGLGAQFIKIIDFGRRKDSMIKGDFVQLTGIIIGSVGFACPMVADGKMIHAVDVRQKRPLVD